jgi:hypothetical protein
MKRVVVVHPIISSRCPEQSAHADVIISTEIPWASLSAVDTCICVGIDPDYMKMRRRGIEYMVCCVDLESRDPVFRWTVNCSYLSDVPNARPLMDALLATRHPSSGWGFGRD